jgi:PleD family two-component response regulator
VTFSSRQGHGSTFELVMPFGLSNEEHMIGAAPAAALTPKFILIVDDMPLNLMILNKVLEHDGHKVEKAQDGHDAVKKAADVRFDLILLDISMPGMDGYEVAN